MYIVIGFINLINTTEWKCASLVSASCAVSRLLLLCFGNAMLYHATEHNIHTAPDPTLYKVYLSVELVEDHVAGRLEAAVRGNRDKHLVRIRDHRHRHAETRLCRQQRVHTLERTAAHQYCGRRAHH